MRQVFDKYYHKFLWVLIVVGCYVLVGCGPIYNTEYTFQPPLSPEGKTCIFQCENSKLQCKQIEDMKEESCLLRSQLECRDRKDCPTNLCDTNYTMCKEMYRNCYQACGGNIDTKKVCVFNCK